MPWTSQDWMNPDAQLAWENGSDGVHQYHKVGGRWVLSDAEQDKQSGGMIALYLRPDDAHKLAVPGGEPVEDIHLTLAYLGEDVSGLDPSALYHAVASIVDNVTVITARIMGYGLFNPDGGPDGDKDPCAVYLVSDSEQIPDLHNDIQHAVEENFPDAPPQHKPFIPHVTAGYGLDIAQLSYTGPILFDRVGLDWAGDDHFFPLMGATHAY
jgi:2'-5' RNA ligase